MSFLSGYKTYIAAAMMAAKPILEVFGLGAYSEMIMELGIALGVLGVGHKLKKMEK